MPHLALPTLTAFLRAHGVEVAQRDLSVESFDAVLTRAYLEQAIDRLHRAPLSGQAAQTQGAAVAERVEGAKAVLRSPDFYVARPSLEAFLTIVQALELASLPFYPASLGFTDYLSAAPDNRSADLLHAVRDSAHNMFIELFRAGIVADIARELPDLVAISIPTQGQMLPAMTLAYLLKAAGLPCHITVGGPHITMLREQLLKTPAMFDLFDSAALFEGELPLLRLLEALDGGKPLSTVPNLLYREHGRIYATPIETSPFPDLLPDFAGLQLDRYLVPEPVLPLLSAHGCYHAKCGFCNVGYGRPRQAVALDPDRVVEHMLHLKQRFGARHIFFADEAMTPPTARRLSHRLAAEGAPLHWCVCARFDRALTRDLLDQMAAGGCRMLLFGLETASPSMIKAMHKGTQPEIMSRILRDSSAAGIWNHAFFFFGFPGETMADAQETVNFLYAHQDALHSASAGTFVLERYSPVHRSPAAYHVARMDDPPERDLAIDFDYELSQGIGNSLAETLVSRLVELLPSKRFGQYYINDVYRLLYAGYLRQAGQVLPLWIADPEPEPAGA